MSGGRAGLRRPDGRRREPLDRRPHQGDLLRLREVVLVTPETSVMDDQVAVMPEIPGHGANASPATSNWLNDTAAS
ncbi:hypothetical protein Ae406Ps2_1592c [Pseudonocardia sp. Ae406_Ps2]|nr:hypothetical protein Ae406Ps2_1592c [Pseudonocardia sp. Ae406_Ps2]OLM06605.1 hypothetical protein Ae331Ps2_4315 [Pseudonocardia sp. Ae331_Ps2]OLM13359.1 hypothetical protein Ae505Ps2_3487 [Pseudonocardia sp. Ae505_Ps2]OLM23165.1 hypothetical protein Ae706Ps2_1598c [Pseudonocardia sp. Ae706_Ps2]